MIIFLANRGPSIFFELWITYNSDVEPAPAANISNISFDKSEVISGMDTIIATITLNNSGNQTGTFYIASSSISNGGDIWYDWNPPQTSISLDANESGTVSLNWSPDESVSTGIYGFYTAVFKDSAGSEYYTDDWRDSAFSIVEAPIPMGSAQVDITPQNAIDAGANWRIDGGDWQGSGTIISEVTEGAHIIEFNIIEGFMTPGNQSISITSGQTATVLGHYFDINDDDDGDGVPIWIEDTLGTDPAVNDLPGPGIHYKYDKLGRITRILRIPGE